MSESLPRTLDDQYSAFLMQVEGLMKRHHGEFVLFGDGEPSGFFGSYGEAYSAGLKQFGPDQEFLIQEVANPEPASVSISWESGIAFG